MKRYYWLRITRMFFMVAAAVVSIATVSGVGGQGVIAISNGKDYDIIQGLTTLITGGLIALILFTISEALDALIRDYIATMRVLKQTKKSNELNGQILDLMTVQLEVLSVEYGIDKDVKLSKVMAQIAQRRARLEQQDDDD